MISNEPMAAYLRKTALFCILILLASGARAAPWRPIGPDGGDARSLAVDPHDPDHILLGTSSSQLFASEDGGYSWSRLARVGNGDHYVLDHILFDPVHPGTLYVAAWSVENEGGDVFRSDDDGKTWRSLDGLHDKSVRAFALAPSDPNILVAGTLDGVYRSRDRGATWERISPEHHAEIKNIVSLAIDPQNPDGIYVGTWHLPWKTEDGGQTWFSIKKGVIDDSDVFSIIIDPRDPKLVYVSACTGIYKSESAGTLFKKVQGIPTSARRTRALRQHPIDPNIVYAGTTEGLWRTVDAGATWNRMTPANVIVNDVLVDARRPGTVLLATDRGGVLRSEDGGRSFQASNRGFSHRQVAALLVDRSDPNVIYAGVINDKEFGGMFISRDAGQHWAQMNDGLAGHDIFTLRQAEDGTLLAGTNRGVVALRPGDHDWRSMGVIWREVPGKPVRMRYKHLWKIRPAPPSVERSQLSARVADLNLASGTWFAATSDGLFLSTDGGRSWRGGGFLLGLKDFISVDVAGKMVTAATPTALLLSLDGGFNWYAAKLPSEVLPLLSVTIGPEYSLWLATRGGAYHSLDAGNTWQHVITGLDPVDVTSVVWDTENRRLLATAVSGAFESMDGGRTWRRTGEPTSRLRGLSLGGGRVYARTDFDGVIAQADRMLSETSTRGSVAANGSSE